jgi:hypothetical protein
VVNAVRRLGPEVKGWKPFGEANVGAEEKVNDVVRVPLTVAVPVIVNVVLLVYALSNEYVVPGTGGVGVLNMIMSHELVEE